MQNPYFFTLKPKSQIAKKAGIHNKDRETHTDVENLEL